MISSVVRMCLFEVEMVIISVIRQSLGDMGGGGVDIGYLYDLWLLCRILMPCGWGNRNWALVVYWVLMIG